MIVIPESPRPNIPLNKQTIEQLKAEIDYWEARIDEAESWGAAVGVAGEFCRACRIELARRGESPDGT